MKKTLLSLAILTSFAAQADEGMWMPSQLPQIAAQLRQAGYAGDPAALADFVVAEHVALTLVGPEAPLASGIVNLFRARGLKIFDATCPLVTKVHVEVSKMRKQGAEIIMIGHQGHPEVEGTMGQAEEGMHLVETVEDVETLQVANPELLAYVSQTTLSVDDTLDIIAALKKRFPNIIEPKKGDICYATTNRQEAVKFMAPQVEVVVVVGSPNSSNSNRLREVADKMGTPAYMVDNATAIDPAWIAGKRRIGVTAGASAPEVLVQAVIDRLKELGAANVRALEGVEENVTFPLPKGLDGVRADLA